MPFEMHPLPYSTRQSHSRPRNHCRTPQNRPVRMDVSRSRRRRTLLGDAPSLHLQTPSRVSPPHSVFFPAAFVSQTNVFGRQYGPDSKDHPQLVPIMIGNTSANTEKALARALAPYLPDPSTAWVISSDFAHWGDRFRYTYYRPSSGPPTNLKASSKTPKDPEIHESIKQVDFECMGVCEQGSHDAWLSCLEANGNTVCGRHPIGVMMAMMEEIGTDGRFRFVRYERSGEVKRVAESSVSYCSAFAVV